MRNVRWAGLLFLLALGVGCSRDLKFTVTFDDAQGLVAGDPVVWGKEPIGRVEEVRYTQAGGFEVKAVVEERFRAAATDRVRFVVSDRPQGGGRRLEAVELEKGGTPLADGAVVRGTTQAELFGESVSRRIKGFLDRLKSLPKSDWAREFTREADRLAEEMARAGREARETLKREVLPELEKKLEELRRKLRELGREKEAEPVETKLRELRGA